MRLRNCTPKEKVRTNMVLPSAYKVSAVTSLARAFDFLCRSNDYWVSIQARSDENPKP